MAQILSTNTFTTAKWIVSATSSDGTHTTIAAALTSASSGDTIFIRPGTYTENLTLKAGVNLTAFECDSSLNGAGSVIISGTCTLTTAGSVTISGIQLQTNSASVVAVTGSAASIVNLVNCYINATNSDAITLSSSSSSSRINVFNCNGDLGTTGIKLFAHSGAGRLTFQNSVVTNLGLSTTASTVSGSGTCNIFYCTFNFSITTSSTSSFQSFASTIQPNTLNITAITIGGTGTNVIYYSHIASGTASAVSVSSSCTLTMNSSIVNSSNTNAITGAGTINYAGIMFIGTSVKINTTTQTGGLLQGGVTQAPSAGFIGEAVRAFVPNASSVSVATATATNVTSISLTAGIWDVSAVCAWTNQAITGTVVEASISTVSATRGTQGDNNVSSPTMPTTNAVLSLIIPSYRLTLTATTTVYLVAYSVYTVGSQAAFGRISATRVG